MIFRDEESDGIVILFLYTEINTKKVWKMKTQRF